MLLKQWKVPWSQVKNIEDIQRNISMKQVQIRHIFREANQFADYLANMALDQAEKIQVRSFYNLPSKGRRIINIDKQQILSLRIKTRRINPTS
ncbi:hypothetical protein MTR67_036823 [Solanum verrucosum]|uniref:RNase H type-1 domain-containing protein n=1 Tax=Solanum verrucosum TaxID=315347 RepID=A0AAF0UCR8_SOLVR|nr:hypothetical protein MTR67_036823 [Solanum verrucosum]